jgi:hypothetical protein
MTSVSLRVAGVLCAASLLIGPPLQAGAGALSGERATRWAFPGIVLRAFDEALIERHPFFESMPSLIGRSGAGGHEGGRILARSADTEPFAESKPVSRATNDEQRTAFPTRAPSLEPPDAEQRVSLVAMGATPPVARRALQPIPGDAQTRLVERYLGALQHARYADAFALLNSSAQSYYRDAHNLGSVYDADRNGILTFRLIGMRSEAQVGRVYFVRETARFRDHAHDTDLRVTATVPVGVIRAAGGWAIKDPGHPWRAFASQASTLTDGIRVTVKKLSFFARRIEAVISVVNESGSFVTFLPYGKSVLRDSNGDVYRPIEIRDWTLTDKTFFEGLRLAPNAQYTGMLGFTCEPLNNAVRTFALTFAPVIIDGGEAPFAVDVDAITDLPARAAGGGRR